MPQNLKKPYKRETCKNHTRKQMFISFSAFKVLGLGLGTMFYVYNHSYLGGGNQESHG
jgi:hypothetical protein